MSGEPDEALEVLRGIWSAQGQTSANLDDLDTGRACKRMADVGFSEMDGAEDDVLFVPADEQRGRAKLLRGWSQSHNSSII